MNEQTNQDNNELESSGGINIVPASALEAIQRAEVDIAIATAKRYPRDIARSLKTCRELALRNARVAATCNYVVPRGGKKLVGPSVHFARIVTYAWGNNTAISRVVGCDRENAHLQGVYHDLESNSRIGIEMDWPVQPPREDSRNPDAKPSNARWLDQMNLAKRAGAAVALRTAIFNCVPMVLFEDIAEEAKQVALGGKSFSESRDIAVRICKEKGITQPMVYAALGVGGLESITTDHLIYLHALLQSVADGTMTIIEAFGSDKMAPVKASVPKSPSKSAAPSNKEAAISKEEKPASQEAKPEEKKAEAPLPEEKPKEQRAPAESKPKTKDAPKAATSGKAPQDSAAMCKEIRVRLSEAGIDEQAVIDWMDNLGVVKNKQVVLDEVAPKWLKMLLDKWEENLANFAPVKAEKPKEGLGSEFPND